MGLINYFFSSHQLKMMFSLLVAHIFLSAVHCGNIESVNDAILFRLKWKDSIADMLAPPKIEEHETISMLSSDKEPYVCYIPRVLHAKGDDTESKNYKGPTPLELLEPLFTGKLCKFKLDSYWTYQLCHGKAMRQYHEDTAGVKVTILEFFLGKYDDDTRRRDNSLYKLKVEEAMKETGEHPAVPTLRIEGVDYPYFSVNMSFGTLCDINQKPRSTEVLYICDENSDHDIVSFEESSTCKYKVIVRTPILCSHPSYRVEIAPENEISCHPDRPKTEKLPEIPLLNQPKKLQEIDKDNEDFRKSAMLESEGSYYESDLKNLVDVVERNLKLFFMQDERPAQPEYVLDSKQVKRLFSGELCWTGGNGWWRYEFCYGKRVSQFHLEKKERKQEILLGKWNEAKHRAWVDANPSRKVPVNPTSVTHYYTDGAMCEVTGRPRTVEVKLVCKGLRDRSDDIGIKLLEPKPCEYKLTVENTVFCKMLANVDEDGLPEEQSPATNGHRAASADSDDSEEDFEDDDDKDTVVI